MGACSSPAKIGVDVYMDKPTARTQESHQIVRLWIMGGGGVFTQRWALTQDNTVFRALKPHNF